MLVVFDFYYPFVYSVQFMNGIDKDDLLTCWPPPKNLLAKYEAQEYVFEASRAKWQQSDKVQIVIFYTWNTCGTIFGSPTFKVTVRHHIQILL